MKPGSPVLVSPVLSDAGSSSFRFSKIGSDKLKRRTRFSLRGLVTGDDDFDQKLRCLLFLMKIIPSRYVGHGEDFE